MNIVYQPPGSSLCGQACVAMCLGVSLDDAIAIVGHRHATSTRQIRDALLTRDLWLDDHARFDGGPPPVIWALVRQHWRTHKKTHWVLLETGKILDPLHGRLTVDWSRCTDRREETWYTSYWEITSVPLAPAVL